jgi:bifunctional DNA-binding transcriptional regulator/antitoxin component of YhaV-PrlF toxin-antitoxin module
MRAMTVQVRRRGTITLPHELRQRYHLGEGDVFTLIDLGEGNFLLTPHVSQLARLGDAAAQELAREGVSLEELLEALDRERETYYREHYQGAEAEPLSR